MITWDEKKRKQVIKDHGVDLARLSEVLEDPFAIFADDTMHSHDERRMMVIDKHAEYGLVMAIFTAIDDEIRFITARRAERWMVREYEKQRRRH